MAFAQGDIVIATVRPPRGEVKRRPAVVVTPTPLIEAATMIKVVGVTASYRPDDPDAMPLGWRADGRIHTRLCKDSAATAGLMNDVKLADVEPTGGYLSRSELISLLAILKRLGQA